MDRSDEESRRRARIFDANDAGFCRAVEVVFDDLDAAPRRAVLVHAEVARVHEDGDVLREDVLRERDELLGDAPEHRARIGCRGVDARQLDDERRRLQRQMHGLGEQRVLRRHVAQQRGRRDPETCGDVRQRGAFEPLGREGLARGGQQAFAADDRGPAHL